jgi:hypothetical protein
MADADCLDLLGTYHAPPFRVGQVVCCQVRGRVTVTGLTAARIPWPVGKKANTGRGALVVCEGLAEALRDEATSAVARWWGVSPNTVSRWRRALGIARAPGQPRINRRR